MDVAHDGRDESITFSKLDLGQMPRVVLVATTDLFLQSRIMEVAKPLGYEVKFVKDEQELTQATRMFDPKLVVLDLSAGEYDPFSCAKTLKTIHGSLSILGFFPHVRTELKTRAKDSGIDFVVPNSSFLKSLKNILSGKVTS